MLCGSSIFYSAKRGPLILTASGHGDAPPASHRTILHRVHRVVAVGAHTGPFGVGDAELADGWKLEVIQEGAELAF